ncbi:hypothetical protein Sango_0301600 [Sesamum angolense]|uniref:Fungal lipase-like domain-containing protein n=1 Tax=Sesamum angolense TaxID=2727404 RepID=A0AAE1X8Y3_9LAMI|nr:hypothetical protein Sango_0301600 [Sesamum angolense]
MNKESEISNYSSEEDDLSSHNRKRKPDIGWVAKALKLALQLYKWARPTGNGMENEPAATDRSLTDTFAIYEGVQNLVYYTELAKRAYNDNATGLARNSMLRENNVVKFIKSSSMLRPGSDKEVPKGSQGGVMGFRLRIVGHSQGGATAFFLAIMLCKSHLRSLGSTLIYLELLELPPSLLLKELAESCSGFITTAVMRLGVRTFRVSERWISPFKNEDWEQTKHSGTFSVFSLLSVDYLNSNQWKQNSFEDVPAIQFLRLVTADELFLCKEVYSWSPTAHFSEIGKTETLNLNCINIGDYGTDM